MQDRYKDIERLLREAGCPEDKLREARGRFGVPVPHPTWGALNATPEEVVACAKSSLLKKQPFFGTLTMHMRIRSGNVPTICVGGDWSVTYNPDWMASLSPAEAEGVFAHEVLHVALKHILRQPKWSRLWNVAADLVVNAVVLHCGLKLPAEGIIPDSNDAYLFDADKAKAESRKLPSWASVVGPGMEPGTVSVRIEDCLGRHMEEVYELLKSLEPDPEKTDGGDGGEPEPGGQKQEQDQDQGLDQDQGRPGRPGRGGKGFDQHVWSKPEGGEAHDKIDSAINKALAMAAEAARRRGVLPGALEQLVKHLMEPKVPWQDILRRHMADALSDEYSWGRLSRRSYATGDMAPGRMRDGGIRCVVHIDTSGSVWDKAAEFLAEAAGIARDCSAEGAVVLCDAAVHGTYDLAEFAYGCPLEKLGGGGGTSHKPVVEWMRDNAPDVKLLITLTDGVSDIPEAFAELPFGVAKVIAMPSEYSDYAERLREHGSIVLIEDPEP